MRLRHGSFEEVRTKGPKKFGAKTQVANSMPSNTYKPLRGSMQKRNENKPPTSTKSTAFGRGPSTKASLIKACAIGG